MVAKKFITKKPLGHGTKFSGGGKKVGQPQRKAPSGDGDIPRATPISSKSSSPKATPIASPIGSSSEKSVYELKCMACGIIGEIGEPLDEFECPQCGGVMVPMARFESSIGEDDTQTVSEVTSEEEDTPTISISREQVEQYKKGLKVAKAINVGIGGIFASSSSSSISSQPPPTATQPAAAIPVPATLSTQDLVATATAVGGTAAPLIPQAKPVSAGGDVKASPFPTASPVIPRAEPAVKATAPADSVASSHSELERIASQQASILSAQLEQFKLEQEKVQQRRNELDDKLRQFEVERKNWQSKVADEEKRLSELQASLEQQGRRLEQMEYLRVEQVKSDEREREKIHLEKSELEKRRADLELSSKQNEEQGRLAEQQAKLLDSRLEQYNTDRRELDSREEKLNARERELASHEEKVKIQENDMKLREEDIKLREEEIKLREEIISQQEKDLEKK